MTEYQVHIALPLSAVLQAWRRYVGYGGSDGGEPDPTWRADDGSGLIATFTAEGREATLLSATRAQGPDAVPDAVAELPPQTLAECVDGFVAYIGAAFNELGTTPGATQGNAPVGPDGTSHMRDT